MAALDVCMYVCVEREWERDWGRTISSCGIIHWLRADWLCSWLTDSLTHCWKTDTQTDRHSLFTMSTHQYNTNLPFLHAYTHLHTHRHTLGEEKYNVRTAADERGKKEQKKQNVDLAWQSASAALWKRPTVRAGSRAEICKQNLYASVFQFLCLSCGS